MFLFSGRYSRLYQIYHKKHETLSTNPPIHIYINKIDNRLVFKIKDRCKLELQTPETIKPFGSTKKLVDETNNGENFQSHEVVLVQCNLVDDRYQQKSKVLYSFTSNKLYASLLNVEPSNLVLLKTYNTEFDDVFIIFTDQNVKFLEIKAKVNFTLLINKYKWQAI